MSQQRSASETVVRNVWPPRAIPGRQLARRALGACAVALLAIFAAAAPAGHSSSAPFEGVFSGSSSAHTCAITAKGAVQCWGRNSYGQLGEGTASSRARPTDVLGLNGTALAVATGHEHTCALIGGGEVKCWGRNRSGQLGDGTTSSRATVAAAVDIGTDVVSVAAGFAHTCALTASGAVVCWGNNLHGQLGIGTVDDTPRSRPVPVIGLESGVAAIAAGDWHTCALTTAGALKCWGENLHGQVGDGRMGMNQPSPIGVSGLASGVAAVAPGRVHTCAVTTGGSVKCWGGNQKGQLGDGTTTRRTSPVDVAGLDGPAAAIGAGSDHSCALLSAGRVSCWGAGEYGELGDGASSGRASPVAVFGLAGVDAIAVGAEHSCAASGDVDVCWGRNEHGQLGNGTAADSGLPVAIASVKEEPPSTPPQEDGDSDGLADSEELLIGTDPLVPDTDADGCMDGTELGAEPSAGGQRDPLNFWDFMDVPTGMPLERDAAVAIADIAAIVARFGASGDAGDDPLTPPPAAPAYHASYDRGGSAGPNVWNLLPPDGGISVGDITAAVNQFGHSCE